jgi:hypothetical protein
LFCFTHSSALPFCVLTAEGRACCHPAVKPLTAAAYRLLPCPAVHGRLPCMTTGGLRCPKPAVGLRFSFRLLCAYCRVL